jgi:hypothetical protein
MLGIENMAVLAKKKKRDRPWNQAAQNHKHE